MLSLRLVIQFSLLVSAATRHCAPRYINLGMPKSGSSSIYSFYHDCMHMSASHWKIEDEFVGLRMEFCDKNGLPLFDCSSKPCVDVVAQMDFEGDHTGNRKTCYIPQITHIEGIIFEYPNATFLLPTRDPYEWASSVMRWTNMAQRLSSCHFVSVEAPKDGEVTSLVTFYKQFLMRTRTILHRAEKLHGLRWVEFDITAPNASRILASTVPGGRPECWTQKNRNKKNPSSEIAEPHTDKV